MNNHKDKQQRAPVVSYANENKIQELRDENLELKETLAAFFKILGVDDDKPAGAAGDYDHQVSVLEDTLGKLKAELKQSQWIESELRVEITHLKNHINSARNFAVYQLVPDMTNETLKVAFVSPSFSEFIDASDPMNHDSWLELLHPDELELSAEVHKRAFRETHTVDQVLRFYHHGKKDWRWLQFFATATNDEDGKPKWVNGIVFDVSKQKRAELKMLEYQKRLQVLTQRQLAGEERERRRVAEVLHDDVGQDLALALFKMNQAKERQEQLEPVLNEIAPLIEQAISYTRSLTKELCPPALCQMGLESGIRWLVARTKNQYGIGTELEIKGDLSILEEDIGNTIFRIIAELLNNVAKHAMADKVRIVVEKGTDRVYLQVEDNGGGFEYSPEALFSSEGFGLFMISERLRSVEGVLGIESKPGGGTKVTAEMPVNS